MPLQALSGLRSIPASSQSTQKRQFFRRLGSRLLRRHSLVALGTLLQLMAFAIPLNAATLLKTIPVGTAPGQVVVNPSTHLAYVVNQGSNNISVIDTQLLKVKATLTVGSAPVGIAANPVSGKVYVANSGSGSITVISGITVQATWTIGGTPSALVVDPVRSQLYVADTSLNQVEVLNATSGAVLTTVPTALTPAAMTINIATHAVFIACTGSSGSVVVFDGIHNSVITTVGVVKGSTSISADPASNLVVVESPSTDTHTVINAGSGYTVQTQILSTGGPLGSAYGDGFFFVTWSASTQIAFATGDSGLFTLGNSYVTNLLGGGGLTVNPSSNQMVVLYPAADVAYLIDLLNPLFLQNYHELTFSSKVAGAAFDPLANKLFITSGHTVSAFDISPRELVDAYEGDYSGNGYNFNYIDSNPVTGMMYTARLGNVFAVNETAAGAGDDGTSQNTAGVTTIPLPSNYSEALAVNVASNKIFVGGYSAFYSIDGATNIVTAVSGLPANTRIRSMAMDYATNELIAWDYFSGNVLVLDGATGALLKTIPTTGSTGPIVVDSVHSLAYLGGYQNLFVINPATGTLAATIPVPAEVMAIALNPAKNLLYEVDNFKNLLVINTSTNTVVTTITLAAAGNSIAVNPISGNYYACTTWDVLEYSSATNKLIKDFSYTAYPPVADCRCVGESPHRQHLCRERQRRIDRRSRCD